MAKEPKGKKAETEKASKPARRKQGEFLVLSAMVTFKSFKPRFMVNGDKLELVFEVDWDHMADGTLDLIQGLAKKFGSLVFTEAQVQPNQKKSQPLPGQLGLPGIGEDRKASSSIPLGGEEIK